ncbi:unnamed protein product [Caenorhabditis sp. 36 PRJEB53466]|nr:unnamed protein product [Caenorhabditis sp. 36 PRJEB53466]
MEASSSVTAMQNIDETLSVQSDWHLALKEPISQFFVRVKPNKAEKSEYFDIQITKLVDEYGLAVLPGNGNIKTSEFTDVNLDEKKNLHITFQGKTTIFMPPSKSVRVAGLTSAPRVIDCSSGGITIVCADGSGKFVVSCAKTARLSKLLEGHLMDVYRCAYFPSGRVVLSAGMDMTLRIWTSNEGHCVRIFKGHRGPITGIGIIGVGRDVLSCSNDGTARMWCCNTSKTTETWKFDAGKCRDLRMSADRLRFAVICERALLSVIDLFGDKTRRDIPLPAQPSALCFSGDNHGEIVFVGFGNGHVAAYSVVRKCQVGDIDTRRGCVNSLKFHKGRLICAFETGSVLVYQLPPLPSDSSTTAPPNIIAAEYELTGPDCDPIYDVAVRESTVYTCCRDGLVRIMSCLRPLHSLYLTQIRWKTVKFKPKIAKTRPLKTASAQALDHFDFYYGPLFGKKWPSIRLGLLSPNRYLAVMNTMSRNWQAHEEILADMGSRDFLAGIRGKNDHGVIETKRKAVEERANEETLRVKQEIAIPSTSSEPSEEALDAEQESIFRSAAGLGEFRASPGELSSGSLQMGKGPINNTNVEVTGFEGEGVRIPKRDHFMYYPTNLRVRAFERAVLLDFPAPMKDEVGVPSYWLLDGGSLLPVLALGLQSDDSLLDMCAAPGGKSLLAALSGLPSKIVCNDFKLARLGQLKRALMTYVPEDSETIEKFVLKRKDASDVKTWDEFEAYDKVLADVPCSTDRLSVSTDDGNIFSTDATQQRLGLPVLQTKILVNALRSVKVGGSVVYSTCTLSPSQNEAVVENAVAIVRKDFGIETVEESLHQLVSHMTASGLYRFHDTPLGALVVPFLPSNFGPMYICKLTRLQ